MTRRTRQVGGSDWSVSSADPLETIVTCGDSVATAGAGKRETA